MFLHDKSIMPEKRLLMWLFKCYSNQFQIYLSQIFQLFFQDKAFCKKAVSGFKLGSPWWKLSILTTTSTHQGIKIGLKSTTWFQNRKVASIRIDWKLLLKHLNIQIFYSPKLAKITWQVKWVISSLQKAFSISDLKKPSLSKNLWESHWFLEIWDISDISVSMIFGDIMSWPWYCPIDFWRY